MITTKVITDPSHLTSPHFQNYIQNSPKLKQLELKLPHINYLYSHAFCSLHVDESLYTFKTLLGTKFHQTVTRTLSCYWKMVTLQ